MTDIITMLANISQSLIPVQQLITALGYLMGLIFMIIAIQKLKKIGDSRARGSSSEKMFVPLAYFASGTALIFLPTALTVLSNTAFGPSGNIIQYSNYNPINIVSTMKIIIRVVGVIWFVRGCVLVVQGSEPGVQHGPKGLAFLCAGVLAVNMEGTTDLLNYIVAKILGATKSIGT